MSFIRPGNVGDVLCVYARTVREGRTSLSIGLEAWVLRERINERLKVTEGVFVFVALNAHGQPRPLAPD